MNRELLKIGKVPALLLGEKADKVYLFVHGKDGRKEEAAAFAEVVGKKGWQVLGIDLPGHGDRTAKDREDTNEDVGFYPWTAVPEIKYVMEYIKEHWNHVALRANSIGAWFSMLACQGERLEQALFVSPMVDMEKLICDMMTWANVDEDELKEKGVIETSFGETLSWRYLSYVRNEQLMWDIPTKILYAGHDNLISRETMNRFITKQHADLTVMEEGEHWFHTKEQLMVLQKWEEKMVAI